MNLLPRKASGRLLSARDALACSLMLVALAIAGRHALEQSMAWHMLVQIPMLLAAGSLAGFGFQLQHAGRTSRFQTICRRLRPWDENGLTGLTLFLLVSGFWMIPKALDHAVASAMVDGGKVASLLLAGWILPGSLGRANKVIQLFFIGNFAWMTAIVGMLYQDAPRRLCNYYLMDDQTSAGTGLVILAFLIPMLWCIRNFGDFVSADASAPAITYRQDTQ